MKRPRKRAFHHSEEEASDSEDDQDFSQYIKRKSAVVQKVQHEQKFDLDDASLQASAHVTPKPSSTSLIESFKASKKQREMDKLFSQSLKARIERESETCDMKDKEVYITKEYEDVKKDLDKAFELAHEEEDSELRDKDGPHTPLLQATPQITSGECVIRGVYGSDQSCIKMPRNGDEKPKAYKNDIYVTRPSRFKPQEQSYRQLQQDVEPTLNKRALVQQFLLPKKSKQMIEIEIKRYQNRTHKKAA